MAHSYPIKRKRRARGPELTIALAIIGGAILLLAVLAVMVAGRPARPAAGGEVFTGRPITAVHDMGDGPPIPFLPQGGPQPNVTVPEASYDFGRIGAKDIVTRTFLLRNDGDAPLTISRAYTTCGCTTATISADVVPPGKAVTAELRFDAGFHDTAGQTVRRGLIIESNDPDQPRAEIWVQAEVTND
jgi:hypothetical protein